MQKELFDLEDKKGINNPKSYDGLYGFHKYWGKKPAELYSTLIEKLTNEDDIVVDPFVGSGVLVREALLLGRRVIASDLNPAAIELTRLMVMTPSANKLTTAIEEIKQNVYPQICETYQTESGGVATHYIWDQDNLIEVRERHKGPNKNIKRAPTDFDRKVFENHSTYCSKQLRPLNLQENSRINVKKGMNLNDIFTGRALKNIDLLLSSFAKYDDHIKRALYLLLTSSIGQMSKMVFTINGGPGKSYQVGSWVIGFWKPKLHFEINVWNCFENKANKLIKSLHEIKDISNIGIGDVQSVLNQKSKCSVELNDAITQMNGLPPGSIKLILTDPPHGDRIPYLELSDLWNSILHVSVDYEKEIIKTNAKGREQISREYESRMLRFYEAAKNKLADDGYFVLIFNSTKKDEWKAIEAAQNYFDYLGVLPAYYSAGSVVQDNRKGSLKSDLILMFSKKGFGAKQRKNIKSFQEFESEWPSHYSDNNTEVDIVE
ncbi:DNA methyltransferase [Polynucleobacter sinensis]|uniref:DNA methyltransferase n=1 Tax=Polynucleobacter sinensis TaxID=1743157 RepID=UPI0007834030|nr:DNA methyltransferase [Polynucleobacter sinensis]